MKKILVPAVSVFAMAVLLNGCSKCSQDRPQDTPPPVVEAPATVPPADGTTPPAEGQPTPDTAPPAPATGGEGH